MNFKFGRNIRRLNSSKRLLKILETRGHGRSQGLCKIFRAAIYRAHRAVVFAIAQLSCSINKKAELSQFAKMTARCTLYMDALKKFESPWVRPRLQFSRNFNGLLFRLSLWMCVQNLNFVLCLFAGYSKKLDSLETPTLPFLQNF